MSKGIFVRCCFNFNSTYDDEAAGNYQSDDAKVKIKEYQQEHGTKLIALLHQTEQRLVITLLKMPPR